MKCELNLLMYTDILFLISDKLLEQFKQLPYSTLRRAKLTVQSWSNDYDETVDEAIPVVSVVVSAYGLKDDLNKVDECYTACCSSADSNLQIAGNVVYDTDVKCLTNCNRARYSSKDMLVGQIFAPSYNYDVEDGQYAHEYSDSGMDSDVSDEQEQANLRTQVSQWYAEEKATGSAVDSFLKLLHPYQESQHPRRSPVKQWSFQESPAEPWSFQESQQPRRSSVDQ
jgi:hypothetical protein